MKNKTILRNKMKHLFKSFAKELLHEKDMHISDSILTYLKTLQGVKNIACFWGVGYEPKTQDLFKKLIKEGYQVFFPKILSHNDMTFYKAQSIGELEVGSFSLLEPKNTQSESGDIDVFLVPGIAFSSDGKRLGKGKGYYDKFFSQEQYKNTQKIGVCYDFQIVTDVPTDGWDIGMDKIIS